MKNVINYYYNLYPENIHQNNNMYYFYLLGDKYFFIIYSRPREDIGAIYELNRLLSRHNSLNSELLLNKEKNIITLVNNIPYLLLKVHMNATAPISILDIEEMSKFVQTNREMDILKRDDWVKLWSEKIDYFEYQISQFGNNYPIIRESLSYFIGMAENAISYVKNAHLETAPNNLDNLVVQNKRISHEYTLFDFYNPMNVVIDHKSRNISEYIKYSFIYNKINFEEIYRYFENNYFSKYGIRLFFGRMLYPSFYFDLYEDVIEKRRDEKDLLVIIKKVNDYEDFLQDLFVFLSKKYDLPKVEWLIKK